jgi:hypothetical protein
LEKKTYNKYSLQLLKLQQDFSKKDNICKNSTLQETKEKQQLITNTFFKSITFWDTFNNWVKNILSNPNSRARKTLSELWKKKTRFELL